MWSEQTVSLTNSFSVLDAVGMTDDFYYSLVAYWQHSNVLAVGLKNTVYGWAMETGIQLLNDGPANDGCLTSIAFSSTRGCKGILAMGRSNNQLTLMSLYDRPEIAGGLQPLPRFKIRQDSHPTCLSWKPTCTPRSSRNPFSSHPSVKTEELLVGDHAGKVWYYSVEWPEIWEVNRDNWKGEMILLAVINLHSEHICGLAWSPTGSQFATGSNDNDCCLLDASKIIGHWGRTAEVSDDSSGSPDGYAHLPTTLPEIVELGPGDEEHRWTHAAAVKAIAFCPWQEGLVATGGGLRDRRIHFFHAASGSALATISVSSQVTSLIWSTTRREIVATFGYTQPAHPYRIAVFSWPECRLIAAVPWADEHRALHAVAHPCAPGGPRRPRKRSRASTEGCIVVVGSDETLRFHEVWPLAQKSTAGAGIPGGSEILEHLYGFDKEGDVIR